jgi:hypothetical protein
MVAVPHENASAADISAAIDTGQFYASTGVELEYDLVHDSSDQQDIVRVRSTEPVVWGVTGGIGSADPQAEPLRGFNVSLCFQNAASETVTNCETGGSVAPQPSRDLMLDLPRVAKRYANYSDSSGQQIFFVRVQAHVRSRYTIVDVDRASKHNWRLTVSPVPNASVERMRHELVEGANLRATGQSRRPIVVESAVVEQGNFPSIKFVSHFSDGDGDITPDLTSLHGLEVGKDQVVAERWAWMQPIFRKVALHSNGSIPVLT